ncbi:SusC/RagA family TonB-linked outer membrane protein [Pedobacter gandavensis]|uniref:SusC/RagA family TonB-linked outer membrane protein n=1 Tax=Pedobacter gandavensis TaxID=2679963 RepID=A0ABR6EXS8_9SPHI|nr:SusC/RagA family TonB-linked outer membrane protein [Pedobacter gandavensis]MBB2150093.1 SusC/RagA family TonB-linked outer membrane protein [Pedobacter gandavensis]
MKKLLQSLFILMFIAGTAVAQNRTISGTVTDKADGNPLPGVTVRIVSTKIGAQTSGEGKFSLSAPASATTLEFSYLGYKTVTKAIGASNVINVVMEADAQSLSEVNITSALGITRKERSVGTAQQSLKAEQLTQTKQLDLGTALAGKISGVQVLGGSGAKFGTSKIRVRGISSVDGGRDPLYVVDGVVVPSTSVNMDDVEDLTVLKGPAATSLYGQRGDAGVVVIKSKGALKKGFGVELNHSTTIENVATLPKYQNEYGGGSSQEWEYFKYDPTKDAPALKAMDGVRYHNYQDDVSWGPRFDGLPYAPFYSWNKYDSDYAKTAPYVAQPNNIRDFYETGVQNNTNIAISQSGDKFSGRMSYTNVNQTGVSPNTKADQNRMSLNGTYKPIEKLTINSSINFMVINNFNTPLDGYGTQTAGSFSQWFHRDTNIKKLRNYRNPDGTFTSWNISDPRNSAPKYWDNPYTEAYENISESNTSRVFGFMQASYKLLPDLNINFTAKGNYGSFRDESRVASGTLNQESYRSKQERTRENNFVLDANYKKQVGEFSFNAGAFGELRINHSEDMQGTTVGGFTVPDYYNLSASRNRPLLTSNIFNKKVRSMYGYVNTGYKNFLFLDLNIRNDWSSSLPDNNNSYLYGGAALSFVFSDLIPANDILSFGKATFSAGRTGSDVDPYKIYQTYSPNGFYGDYPSLTVPNQIPNANLKPALSDAYEAGLELRFIKDRLRFNFNYYDRTSKDQIISLSLPSTTGFSSALVNAGEIKSHGFEMSLGGTPIKSKDWTWDINANFAINKNKIVSLYPGLNNFPFDSFGYVGSPRINVERRVGQEWGTIVAPGIKKDANGNNLIDDEGMPIIEAEQNLGSFVPDLTGGFTSMLNYKSFSFGASMDFQIGGKLFSVTQGNLNGSGLAKQTAGLNDKGNPKRDDVSVGGGILIPGIRESDGQPNTTYVNTQEYYQDKMPYVWGANTYKATYFKLRELSLGYALPASFLSKIKAQRATVSLVARNPWLIYTAIPGIDPSESAGEWLEGGQLPGTRTIGLNLKVTF